MVADLSMVMNTITSQKRKLNEEMKVIVKMKATQSAYPSLSRQDKRVAEFHHDRLTQEQSLQKDTKKAERLARRIAQILDQLRKDFNKIKNFLGNYNFTNTVGMDSSCGGACAEDLSTAVDTRQAWKRELENMLTMVWHYVDAQHLGDYALMHYPESSDNVSTCNSSSSTVTNCCPKVYRPFFHYYTPDGDCLAIANAAGSHSGNSKEVTPKGNYNDVTTRGCILGYRAIDNVSPDVEKKTAPASHKHFQITNKDIEIRQLWKLLVGSQGGKTVDREAWWSYFVANSVAIYESGTTAADLKTHFEDNLCLPKPMSDILSDNTTYVDENGDPYDSVYDILLALMSTTHGSGATRVIPPNVLQTVDNAITNNVSDSHSGTFDEALKHAPTVCNVEDEPDLQFIIRLVTCTMENIRKCQINNDREQAVIEYVRDVSECNEAYHQDVFSDMTSIDESELSQRYAVGKELSADLDSLYKENCCTKQNFFNDVTLDGCCW